jgi:hypothetical protein
MDYREVNVMGENAKEFADGKTILDNLFSSASEPDKYKILIDLIANDNNLTLKTELTDRQIKGLTICRMLKYFLKEFDYDAEELETLEKTICELNISRNRKSRKETIEALKGTADVSNAEKIMQKLKL